MKKRIFVVCLLAIAIVFSGVAVQQAMYGTAGINKNDVGQQALAQTRQENLEQEASAQINQDDIAQQEKKIFLEANIDDNFDDNSIIVVMGKNASSFRGISKQLSDSLFDGIGAKSITDLTALPEHFIDSDGSINAKTAPELANHFTKISFKQILQITLEQKSKQNVLDTIKKIEKLDGVLCASPDWLDFGETPNPNDPRLSEQWALIGTNGIKARDAWSITAGSRNVRVGVIDSGIANHNDMNANRVAGWDFYNNNNVTNDDTGGHGTSASGIIGAVGNNSVGISGVAQLVSLVPLQTASNTSGSGTHPTQSRIDAITYARNLWDTNDRISILNHSIAGFGTNFALLAAVEQFPGLFIWSAGNDGDNLDNFANIGQFNLSNLISVGAHDSDLERSVWDSTHSSSYGNAVNVYAPGGKGTTQTDLNVLTTHSTSTTAYRFFNGTSAAAPHVSGVAALMLSKEPGLSAALIKEIILESATSIQITVPVSLSNPTGKQYVKRLDAGAALDKVNETKTVSGLYFENEVEVINVGYRDVYFKFDAGYQFDYTATFHVFGSGNIHAELYDPYYGYDMYTSPGGYLMIYPQEDMIYRIRIYNDDIDYPEDVKFAIAARVQNPMYSMPWMSDEGTGYFYGWKNGSDSHTHIAYLFTYTSGNYVFNFKPSEAAAFNNVTLNIADVSNSKSITSNTESTKTLSGGGRVENFIVHLSANQTYLIVISVQIASTTSDTGYIFSVRKQTSETLNAANSVSINASSLVYDWLPSFYTFTYATAGTKTVDVTGLSSFYSGYVKVYGGNSFVDCRTITSAASSVSISFYASVGVKYTICIWPYS